MRKFLKSILFKLLKEDDVEWVVNDVAELGVKIGNNFYFMYKGRSLKNSGGKRWRYVYKREFGECCHPWGFIAHIKNKKIEEVHLPESYEQFTPDGDWKNLP